MWPRLALRPRSLRSFRPLSPGFWGLSLEFGVYRPDLSLSVKVVDSFEEAIAHINRFGSRHTEAIATTNIAHADNFLRSVDSSGVFHNCSTRFADGFRYGFGAEVGISTQTLPPRGPVGLEGLTSQKFLVEGNNHLRGD